MKISRFQTYLTDQGRWITYCFVFDAKKTEKGKYALILKALSDYNSKVENVDAFEVLNREEASLWKWIDHPKVSDSDEFSSLAALQHDSIHLSFAVRYQLEVCLSHGYLHENNLTRTFVERLASMEPIAARDMLERVADTKRRYFNPMEIFAIQIVRPSSARAVPRYCVYARAATVTPSTIYFATPTVEISNRVIRQYVELEDRFLRVKFTDEKTRGRVSAQDNDAHDEVFTRVKRAMSNGIRLGDRHYEFLAFGNSQFREHGAHFFSPTETVTTADIRKWMGDFSQIKIVSKWAARLGQCFSTTRAINGTKVKVLTIADIKRGHYTFTDGVGKISLFLAQMIAAEFGLPGAYDDPPSLFQFRLGGCKGVLAVAPDAKGREIHVRKSQYKFPAKHEGLEIIRTSSFAAAALNRQIIIVLSSLGVQDSVFTDKLQQNLSDLSQAMDDVKLALRLLLKNVDFNQMTLVIASMILDGFMDKKEPFMMSLLKLWRAFNIKFLKEKARIFIEKGAFLLGCVDETGTLRGHDSRFDANPEKNISEVFLQVPNTEKKGSYTVIQGRCIVARNPSLHPGDVRVVNAVDVPALHHLKNVVVFPQTGDRDIPSMCSGGDLDGDDYMIIWDEELMPTLINYPAMDYEAQTPVRLDRDVTVDDITTFFVLYMKNDRLGSIANAHLVHADRSEDGVMDEKCMRLAQLHSDAVDYPKSGIAARMTRDLRPRMWPHFMEKQKDRTYQSKKVLGQLYDQVERADFAPSYREAFDERILNAYELDDSLLKNATEIKELYDAAVRRIMAQHDIATEFEVWSTFVLEHNQESKSYKFGEEIGNIARALKDRFQNMCFQKAGGKDFAQIGPFAAAMYTITARQVISAVAALYSDQMTPDPKKMPLMSFPWLFVKELGKIALGRFLSTCFSVDEEKTVKKVPKQSPFIPKNGIAGPDDIETAQGTTHRGDLLELFEDTPSGSEAPSGRATPAVQQASKDLLLRTGNVRYSLLDDGETEENWETEDETSEKVIPNDVRATEKCGENLLVGDLNSSDAAESKDTLLEKLEQNHQHEKDAEKLIETRSAAGTPPLANGCSDAAQPSLFPQANGTGTCESVAAESSISHTADIECNEPDDHKLDNERLKSNKDSPPIEGISQDEHLEDGEIEEVYLDNDEGPTALERLAQLVGY